MQVLLVGVAYGSYGAIYHLLKLLNECFLSGSELDVPLLFINLHIYPCVVVESLFATVEK